MQPSRSMKKDSKRYSDLVLVRFRQNIELAALDTLGTLRDVEHHRTVTPRQMQHATLSIGIGQPDPRAMLTAMHGPRLARLGLTHVRDAVVHSHAEITTAPRVRRLRKRSQDAGRRRIAQLGGADTSGEQSYGCRREDEPFAHDYCCAGAGVREQAIRQP